ncbi:MAG TPA: hypothetical protein EYH45_02170 [Candidatus Caldiarchaeum subterraneum]|uniref:Inositol monophosphatase n=1 Tax=Caldiarchaeum subterraneum TaxID=311458 RepID=A0A832ZUU0_CALS0|nr:hypothetical protein [Candidatus Caldarchaeum subterraneum]
MEGGSFVRVCERALARARDAVSGLSASGEAGRRVDRGFFGDVSLVADLEAERMIVETLQQELGGRVMIVAEERGILGRGENYDYVAVIDPVDGSNNVSAGIPFYSGAIAIALGERYSDIVAAAVMDYITGDFYSATVEEGALRNWNDRLRVKNDVKKLDNAYISLDPRIFKKTPEAAIRLLQRAKNIRFFGSSVLEIIYVVLGRINAFVAFPRIMRIVDIAAPLFIHSMAGGVVKWLEEGPGDVNLTTTERHGFLASSTPELASEINSLLS